MLSIQIYTIREHTKTYEDALNALKKLKDLGYNSVQLAGNIEKLEYTAKAAKEVGLEVIGVLSNLVTVEENQDKLFEIMRFSGATDIGISADEVGDDAIEMIKRANAFCKIANANGFTFSYHNHSHEFIRGESGKRAIDYIVESFDGDLMPDTYWLQHGGVDVIKFIEDNAKKIKILHLKDMQRTVDGVTFSELGKGNMNMKGIIEKAKELGISSLVVEQDVCQGDSLLSAEISIDYLKGAL